MWIETGVADSGAVRQKTRVRRPETGDRRHETGDVRQEMRDRSHETGAVRQKIWDRRHETGDVRQKMWDRRRDTGGMRHEIGGGRQEAWDRRHENDTNLGERRHDTKDKDTRDWSHSFLQLTTKHSDTHHFSNRNVCDRSQTCQWKITKHFDTARWKKWLFKQCMP